MIAPITTLKLNKKMVLKNTEKVKNIARIRLCRWVFLRMEIEFHSHLIYFPEAKTSRHH